MIIRSLRLFVSVFTTVILAISACTSQGSPPPTEAVIAEIDNQYADVISVQVKGNPGAYQFEVEVASPDTGCDQFADWWEIFDEDGNLIYRRILLHSHVNEQPFVRSGGPVDLSDTTIVYVRAHMNSFGYGGKIMTGSVQNGFKLQDVNAVIFPELEHIQPQPSDCAF